MSELSQTRRARAARQWRATTSERKHFEGPLKEYIKIKYNSIYNEYVEFYTSLNLKYPNTRDLTKTRAFTKWAEDHRQSQQSDDSEGERQDSQDISTQTQPIQNDEATQPNYEPTQPSILTMALQEVLPEGIPNEAVSPELDIVEDLINQLEQDDLIREILDPMVEDIMGGLAVERINDFNNNDEGIEINYYDEILMDIEPFDFDLEVDF